VNLRIQETIRKGRDPEKHVEGCYRYVLDKLHRIYKSVVWIFLVIIQAEFNHDRYHYRFVLCQVYSELSLASLLP
jgi:transcription elongation factor GreA-like protein